MKRFRCFAYKIFILGTITATLISINSVCTNSSHTPQSPDSYYLNNQIIANILFNEQDTGRFIIDTGGSIISVDSLFFYKNIESASLIDTLNFSAGPGSQAVEKIVYMGLSFKYKSEEYKDLFFTIRDFSKNFMSIDGLLGAQFLRDKVLMLDFENERFEFSKNLSQKQVDGLDSIPLKIVRGKPCIQATVHINYAQSITGYFVIDTGFGGTVMLWQKVAEQIVTNCEDLKVHSIYVQGGNFSGDLIINIFRAERFTSNLLTIDQPVIGYEEYRSPAPVNDSEKYPIGLIGTDLLSKFNIILDYPHKVMYYEPIDTLFKQSSYYSTGVSVGFLNTKRLIIQGLMTDSPADSAGIQTGDILLEINQIKASPDTYPEIVKLMRRPGTLDLKLKRDDSVYSARVPVRKLL